MNEVVRHIQKHEMKELLSLYKYLNEDDPELGDNRQMYELWEDILNDPGQHYLVTEVDGKLVSSCVLVIIKNLTRGARPYAIIENVVTHENYRNKGYGTRLLKEAQEIAKENGCYKVMLLTGSKKEETLNFCEKAGFSRGLKTGFIIRFD